MGNNQSNSDIKQELTFVQSIQDINFGKCQLYQKYQNHMQYFLLLHRYLHPQVVPIIKRKLNSLKNLYLSQQKDVFLQIFSYQIKENSILATNLLNTCNIPELTIYIEFLRHNLKDFLNWRKIQEKHLTYDQIVMTLSKAIKAFQALKYIKSSTQLAQSIQFGLNLQSISVTIQGQIKFNPLIEKSFQSLCAQTNYICNLKNHIECSQKLNNTFKRQYIPQNYQLSSKYRFQNMYIQRKQSHISQEVLFLSQLKKLSNELVWDSRYGKDPIRNPEQLWVYERKQIKRLVASVHKARTINQVKQIIGPTVLNSYYTQFQKLKYQYSEAKFYKLASQFYQKSQSTDVSLHQDSFFHLKQFNKTIQRNNIR